MFDGVDPGRSLLRTELFNGVLPWVVDKAFGMPEIVAGIERSGVDEQALWKRVTSDERLLLTSGSEFAAVYRFTRGKRGGINQTVLHNELSQLGWPIRLGIIYDTARKRREARPTSLHEAMSDWCTVMLRDTVLPELRRAINTHLDEDFSATLTISAIPGIERSHDVAFTVDTDSTVRFRAAVARIHGSGALGLAGPRGCGKTALIDQYVAGLYDDDGEFDHVGITVACPVHYEARDFVLHLHATLCRAVLDRIDSLNSRKQDQERPGTRFSEFRSTLGFILAFLAALAIVSYLTVLPDFGRPVLVQLLQPSRLPAPWMAPLFLIGGASAVAAVMLTLELIGHIVDTLVDLSRLLLTFATPLQPRLFQERRPDSHRALRNFTVEQLRHIKLLQTSTVGWSGTATLPWAVTVGRSKSIQLAERSQTFPEIVDALRELITRCTEYLGPVVIAIDELDKVASADRAQLFVNEIKGVFGVPGCLYIVSLSDDALVTFERTTLGVRDAFDSAFDELVRLDYLSLTDSLALLHSRVIGIPEPFGWLCHCLSAGLPRELLRLVRRLVEYRYSPYPPTLEHVCAELVGEDLSMRVQEYRIMASRLTDRTLGDSLKSLAHDASAKDLLAATRQLVRRPTSAREPESDRRRLEAAMRTYHSATIKEVFGRHLDRDKANAACADGDQPGSFNQLSRARSALVEDPRLAWFLIDEFRTAWRLEVVDGRQD